MLTITTGALGAPSQPLALLTATPAVAQSQMILCDAQPTGYMYIGMNQGLAIWGRAYIVQASLKTPPGNLGRSATMHSELLFIL